MLVTTKQKMYLTMHGLVDKGETIDIPEDVINDFGKDCFEFVGKVESAVTEPAAESVDETVDAKKVSKNKTDTTEE